MDQGGSLTDEQVQLGIRVSRIFTPFATEQIDRLYPTRDHSAKYVHYTSADAAISIIKSKRLWMRNATCMADYREVAHGYDFLLSTFKTPHGNAFVSALDSCAPGVAQRAMGLFDSHWPDIRNNTYISSVSEHKSTEDDLGRLSMWRAFGASPSRVALVISLPYYSGAALALGLLFSPVAYMEESEVSEQLARVTANIQSNADFLRTVGPQILFGFAYQMLLAGAVCMKHKAFLEEVEWRAIYGPNRLPSELMGCSTEVIGGVPQTVCKIPLDASVSPAIAALDIAKIFERLIIGPTQYAAAMTDAFVRELKAAGVQDAEKRVVASNIPLRT